MSMGAKTGKKNRRKCLLNTERSKVIPSRATNLRATRRTKTHQQAAGSLSCSQDPGLRLPCFQTEAAKALGFDGCLTSY